MNKDRLQNISDLVNFIEAFKIAASKHMEASITVEYNVGKSGKKQRREEGSITGLLEKIEQDIEDIKGEEEEYKDNMPEALQNSDKGETADNAISSLEDAVSSLTEVKDKLDGDLFEELDNTISSLQSI